MSIQSDRFSVIRGGLGEYSRSRHIPVSQPDTLRDWKELPIRFDTLHIHEDGSPMSAGFHAPCASEESFSGQVTFFRVLLLTNTCFCRERPRGSHGFNRSTGAIPCGPVRVLRFWTCSENHCFSVSQDLSHHMATAVSTGEVNPFSQQAHSLCWQLRESD